MKFLAHGKRSNVFLTKYNGKSAVVKIETRNLNVLRREADILKILNKHNLGPKLLGISKDRLILEYIKGTPLLKYIKNNSKSRVKKILKEVLNQCYLLDKLKINKYELTNPYKDIIIAKKPVLIDFERARFSNKPKNVTQFCQFLSSPEISSKLDKKINKDFLIGLLKNYKNDPSEKNFKKIIESIV